MKIGLLSDTHSHLDERFITHLKTCDQIWHAGDIGSVEIAENLAQLAPLKAVSGNIDNAHIRIQYPENQIFIVEGKKVWIRHIGAKPPRYSVAILQEMKRIKPDIFVCGHSHILLVQYVKELQVLHLNPGAAGIHGFHKVRTILTFEILDNKITNLNVIELPKPIQREYE